MAERAWIRGAQQGSVEDLERNFQVPRQEKVTWKGNDGTPVEGILMYPLDYEAGKRYPLAVQMHAGLYETDKFGAGPGLLQNYFPVLAAKGYAIFRPNFRGNPHRQAGRIVACDRTDAGAPVAQTTPERVETVSNR